MSLKRFYDDKEMMREVHEYLLQELDILALHRVYAKEPTMAIAEAKEAIDEAFVHLDQLFLKEVIKPKQNEAR